MAAQATMQGFYGCSFTGYQDTLLAGYGSQYYKKCYIQGDSHDPNSRNPARLQSCFQVPLILFLAMQQHGSVTVSSKSLFLCSLFGPKS